MTADATDRCAMAVCEIESLLQVLNDLTGEHFGIPHEEANWGHVGSLEYVAARLREAVTHASDAFAA